LTVPERRCLDKLYTDEPLNNMPHFGQKSIDRLIQLRLIEISPNTPFDAETHYRRTADGDRIQEEMWLANRIPK
jgi:hypothetical protein